MIALLLLSTIPHDTILRERFDAIECHQFTDSETGKHVFSQYLFRNFQKADGSLQIEAWRMAKGTAQARECIGIDGVQFIEVPVGPLPRSESVPRFNHARGTWELLFWDGQILRCVEATTFTEFGAWYDPEVTERETFPKEHRRELRQGLSK